MATASEDDLATDDDRWTRPPFLRRVRFQGYKSIAFCDVALHPMTILVGRNASGKSNFLDAIAFLRDLLTNGATEAVKRHGGRKAILHRSSRRSTVSFSLELEFQRSDGDRLKAEYDTTIKLPDRSPPLVVSERVRIHKAGSTTVGFDRKRESVQWEGYPRDASIQAFRECDPEHSAFSIAHLKPFRDLATQLRRAWTYSFSPASIRQLREPMSGRVLDQGGGNLASVIRSIGGENRGVLERIRAYLSTIIAEVEDFRPVRYGDYETIQFTLKAGDGKALTFDAASMSDGSLRALAALVAAFQGRMRSGPSLVGIEEPETALHPSAMRSLVHALDEATASTQILLTTHSADLLDDPVIRPSQVFVVRNREGRTLITPVDAASREIIAKELYSLAELQRQDQLDLDEEDLRRQAAEGGSEGRE